MILSSTSVPTNGYTLLYGTKNGVADVTGQPHSIVSGSFPITNGPGAAGYYSRWVRMYNSSGRIMCQSNMSYVWFQ